MNQREPMQENQAFSKEQPLSILAYTIYQRSEFAGMTISNDHGVVRIMHASVGRRPANLLLLA